MLPPAIPVATPLVLTEALIPLNSSNVAPTRVYCPGCLPSDPFLLQCLSALSSQLLFLVLPCKLFLFEFLSPKFLFTLPGSNTLTFGNLPFGDPVQRLVLIVRPRRYVRVSF